MLVTSRVLGRNGNVREVSSMIDFNSEYCAIFSKDAVALGYNEAAIPPKVWQKSHPDKVPLILDFRGIERATIIPLARVSLGGHAVNDVESAIMEMDLPIMVPFDMVLGRSFLKNFKVGLDMKKGYIDIEPQSQKPRKGPSAKE